MLSPSFVGAGAAGVIGLKLQVNNASHSVVMFVYLSLLSDNSIAFALSGTLACIGDLKLHV